MTKHYPVLALCALLSPLFGVSVASAQQLTARQTVSLPHLSAEVVIYGDDVGFKFSTDNGHSYSIDCMNPYLDIRYALWDSSGRVIPLDDNAWKAHAYDAARYPCNKMPRPSDEMLTRVSLEDLYPGVPHGTYTLQMTLAPRDRTDSVAFAPVTLRLSTWSDESDALVAGSLQLLQRFRSSHSFKDLKAAIDMMSAAFPSYRFTSENLVVQRRALVQGFMPIFKTIEQSYDPGYDPDNPNDQPDDCMIAQDNGSSECNVDPQDVKDPKARAAYIVALQKNEVKAKRTSYYHDLNIIDLEAMAGLEITLDFLRTARFPEAPPDTAALDDILQKAGLSVARRTELEPYITAPILSWPEN